MIIELRYIVCSLILLVFNPFKPVVIVWIICKWRAVTRRKFSLLSLMDSLTSLDLFLSQKYNKQIRNSNWWLYIPSGTLTVRLSSRTCRLVCARFQLKESCHCKVVHPANSHEFTSSFLSECVIYIINSLFCRGSPLKLIGSDVFSQYLNLEMYHIHFARVIFGTWLFFLPFDCVVFYYSLLAVCKAQQIWNRTCNKFYTTRWRVWVNEVRTWMLQFIDFLPWARHWLWLVIMFKVGLRSWMINILWIKQSICCSIWT